MANSVNFETVLILVGLSLLLVIIAPLVVYIIYFVLYKVGGKDNRDSGKEIQGIIKNDLEFKNKKVELESRLEEGVKNIDKDKVYNDNEIDKDPLEYIKKNFK